MIETIYDKENEDLKILINSTAVLQNISHKLIHDKNSVDFFEKIISNIENYENLERMEKYYFDEDFKSIYKTLHLFFKALNKNELLKEKPANDIIKCCNLFPDYIGERIIMLISYIPIMQLFYEEIKYKEYFKGYTSDKSCMGETIEEHQESRLFHESILSTKFPEDDDFINYKLKNRYIDKLKYEYTDKREEEIKVSISEMLKIYNKSKNMKLTKVLIGSTYWDKQINLTTENMKEFRTALEALGNSFEEKRKEKIEKIVIILKEEFSKTLGVKIIELSVNPTEKDRNYTIDLIIEEEVNEEAMKNLQKIFILKREYECTDINFINHSDRLNIKLSCKLEL